MAICRKCGCTDLDCSGCIERTGAPCHWVEPDLCSACLELQAVSTAVPGFWMHETSGVLRPVVESYLAGDHMTDSDIPVMRAYLRQWILAPSWQGAGVEDLRTGIDRLTSRDAIDAWLAAALELGIDPL